MSEVKIYGRDWCEDTQGTREQLEALGVPYDYINIEKDAQAAEWVREVNGGKHRTPTVQVMGKIVVEPDEAQLRSLLKSTGLLA